MKKAEVNFRFGWAILTLLVLFHGEPDIVDGIVYKLTGEWQTSSGFLRLEK